MPAAGDINKLGYGRPDLYLKRHNSFYRFRQFTHFFFAPFIKYNNTLYFLFCVSRSFFHLMRSVFILIAQ